jgi:Protein of unknown function (DUF4232)
MNDMQDEVRQLLRDKATEMPPHLDVPPKLQRRVRPRIARNAVLVAATAVVVAIVAVTGFRSFNGPPDEQSLGDSPTGVAQCKVDQLVPSTALGGAAGSRVGSILLQNTGTTCTLSGKLDVGVTDGDSHVYEVGVEQSEPTWMIDRAPEPDGWPVVTLEGGDSAAIRFSWSNWCQDVTPIVQLRESADQSVVANISMDPIDIPPCNGGGLGSTIELGPFEPISRT